MTTSQKVTKVKNRNYVIQFILLQSFHCDVKKWVKQPGNWEIKLYL